MSSPSGADGHERTIPPGKRPRLGSANSAANRGGGTVIGRREIRQGIQRQPRLPKRSSK